ncbi:hypothetical protein Tco_0677050 [Tanacetum coccineum]
MSTFKVPKCVSNKMEALHRNFFNDEEGPGSKVNWVGWNHVLSSKEKGGLRVSNFFAINRALLFNWVLSSLKTKGIDLLGFANKKSRKDIGVAEKMSHSSLAFSFHRLSKGGIEEEQFSNLISCTSAFFLPQILRD